MPNAAIVGLGRWGRRLVGAVQENGVARSDGIRFTHAVVRDVAKASDYALGERLKLGSSYEEVLADPRVDAVVLATPHSLHTEQIVAAANTGKHVFVEKPFALRLDDASRSAEAATKHGIVLALGHNRRFLPAARELKQLTRGAMGRLLHLDGNFSNNSGSKYTASMWRAHETGPMSAMTAMGIHILDFFIYLNGPIQSVRTTSRSLAMPVAVDDVVSVQLVFRNGALGSLRTMLTTPRRWGVEVFGTEKWAEMPDEHLLNIADEEGKLEKKSFDPVDTVRLELRAFADAIGGGTEYPLSLEDAVHGAAAFEAILESARRGGVDLDVRGI